MNNSFEYGREVLPLRGHFFNVLGWGVTYMKLNREEVLRYSRHFNLAAVGLEGQKRLKASSVLLIGAGGLGSPLALYLAAAGVGRIGLVDFDVVDETNLQRQILHGTSEVGQPKLESARRRLADINPHVVLETHNLRLEADNAMALFANYDVVADGADNFPTRYLVNDTCVLTQTPLVSGSILGFEGQLSVYNYKGGPCYRCLFPEPPPPGSVPSCAEGGVLGILPGVIGCLQATEVIKVLLDVGKVAAGRLLLYDALNLEFNSLNISKDSHCAICGEFPSITELVDYETFCGETQESQETVNLITPEQLHPKLEEFVLIDVRKPFEREICCIHPCQHIELDQLSETELSWSTETPLVTYCKTGVRSRRAALILKQRGYSNVTSLAGGIMAWADRLDPDMFKY